MAEQGVTVVVPTLNRGGFLINCLRDLVAQKHRPLEILVVDQSEEEIEELLQFVDKCDNTISYHHVSFKGLPEARNYGWQNARYDAIAFVDDDIRCGPNLVTEHLASLSLPGVGLVAGGIEEAGNTARSEQSTGTFNPWTATPLSGFAALGEGDIDHARGANFSAWKKAIKSAGGFDEIMNIGAALYEDTDFCLRVKQAGFRIYFNGRARLTHLVAENGGCREENINTFVMALAHNRAILIRRHVRSFQMPVALMRLVMLSISHTVYYQAPSALISCLVGCIRGLHKGGASPTCTLYHNDRKAVAAYLKS